MSIQHGKGLSHRDICLLNELHAVHNEGFEICEVLDGNNCTGLISVQGKGTDNRPPPCFPHRPAVSGRTMKKEIRVFPPSCCLLCSTYRLNNRLWLTGMWCRSCPDLGRPSAGSVSGPNLWGLPGPLRHCSGLNCLSSSP